MSSCVSSKVGSNTAEVPMTNVKAKTIIDCLLYLLTNLFMIFIPVNEAIIDKGAKITA